MLASVRRQQALVLSVGLSILALALLAALITSFLVTADDIETGRTVLSPPCLSHLLFGVDCPTCGLSRAFCALSHGEWTRAIQYNRGAPVAYGLAWVAGGLSLWGVVRSARELRACPGEASR